MLPYLIRIRNRGYNVYALRVTHSIIFSLSFDREKAWKLVTLLYVSCKNNTMSRFNRIRTLRDENINHFLASSHSLLQKEVLWLVIMGSEVDCSGVSRAVWLVKVKLVSFKHFQTCVEILFSM